MIMNSIPSDEHDASRGIRGWATLGVASITGLVLFLAFPPVGWSWLGWIAPAGWIWLIRRERLPGGKPYRMLFMAGLLHWLLLLHWVRLPHWSAWFGWVALAAYLASYLPAFVWLGRVATRRWNLPIVIAAPIVWTGLELIRGRFLTGFSMGLLSHSQVDYLPMIQIADTFGAYGVSFVMIFVATCVSQLVPSDNRQSKPLLAAFLATVMLASVFIYGKIQLGESWTDNQSDPLRVALIQGSMDTTFESDNRAATLQQYFDLTRQALQQQPKADLIVWPESMYPRPWVECVEPFNLPQASPVTATEIKAWAKENEQALRDVATMVGRPLLIGSPGLRYEGNRVDRFNSAQWIVPDHPRWSTARCTRSCLASTYRWGSCCRFSIG